MESPYSVLYKFSSNEILYWQQLDQSKKSVTIYKGKVGELGETIIFQDKLFSNSRKKLYKEFFSQK